jgi:hypothetical protein
MVPSTSNAVLAARELVTSEFVVGFEEAEDENIVHKILT